MILRTPIISESYSPDESAQSDAKSSNNMLGYVALELDLKSVMAPAVQRNIHLRRDDAVLHRHSADLRLATDARRHGAYPQHGEYR